LAPNVTLRTEPLGNLCFVVLLLFIVCSSTSFYAASALCGAAPDKVHRVHQEGALRPLLPQPHGFDVSQFERSLEYRVITDGSFQYARVRNVNDVSIPDHLLENAA